MRATVDERVCHTTRTKSCELVFPGFLYHFLHSSGSHQTLMIFGTFSVLTLLLAVDVVVVHDDADKSTVATFHTLSIIYQ